MKFELKEFSLLFWCVAELAVFLFSSCADNYAGKTITVAKTKGFQPHHGPFDGNGNYVEAWADNPPRRIYVDPADLNKEKAKQKQTVAYAPAPIPDEPIYTPTPVSRPTSANTTYKPKSRPTTAYKPKPKTSTKPKYKPKAIKVKPKSRPPIIHTVRKGDTLYSLARRYKSGVKTIMSANNLKNSNIRIGQKLKIPRF